MKRMLVFLATTLIVVLLAVSCDKLDVVATDSVRSFGELLESVPQLVSEDRTNGGWSIAAPDSSVRFIWSRDFAASPLYDVFLEIDASPFIAAGLNPSGLPADYVFRNGKILAGTKLGNEKLTYNGAAAPIASYEHIVKLYRSSIAYHGQLDHYGISLGDGNLFEWAKNMSTNDKDIVFVLNPEPFIRAGVDPNGIEGWVFAKVTVDDESGKPVEVDKILKPFDLM